MADLDAWPGQLGQWQIGEKLGEGGFGVVYHAIDRGSGEHRAIKKIRQPPPADAVRDALIRRELENCQALAHRNIVRTYASGKADDSYFLVTELCVGGDVARIVKSQGLFGAEEAMKMIVDVLAGLEYAHSAPVMSVTASGEPVQAAGLVHRDIKPQNVFAGTGGSDRVYKIGDFGMAKAFGLAGLSGITDREETGGTPTFMCYQQVVNYKYAKPEVDVWAAAATLYYVLTGSPPRDFPRDCGDPWGVVIGTQPVPIAERGVTVPGRLARVIDEALADRPQIRFQSAAEFRAALEAL